MARTIKISEILNPGLFIDNELLIERQAKNVFREGQKNGIPSVRAFTGLVSGKHLLLANARSACFEERLPRLF
jgi:hypothetical protein